MLEMELRRESDSTRPLKVPLEIVINGARSVVNVEMPEREFTLQGHAVGLDETAVQGWGYVQLPMDENVQDNQSYFAFADPPQHRTVIVSEDRRAAEPMRLAAVSPADPAIEYAAEILPPEAAGEIDWDATSLVLWQARLPNETVADQLLHFVERGKPVICFPPESPGDEQLGGVSWGAWRGAERGESVPVSNWRGDSGLLAHTRGGSALPVGELRTYRTCPPEGDVGALATLDDGSPLLAHVTASGGPLYFCSTLPRADCSSLAQDGVVLRDDSACTGGRRRDPRECPTTACRHVGRPAVGRLDTVVGRNEGPAFNGTTVRGRRVSRGRASGCAKPSTGRRRFCRSGCPATGTHITGAGLSPCRRPRGEFVGPGERDLASFSAGHGPGTAGRSCVVFPGASTRDRARRLGGTGEPWVRGWKLA